jgi:carboxymethylenebutenolidase
MSSVVKLRASDGHELDAYVAEPDGKAWGALVVIQEIFGVNQHIRSVTDRFAQEGFYTVAPALFDRVERHVELTDQGDGTQKGMSLKRKINIEDAIRDVDAALQHAAKKTGKPAGVVGYCYGGTLAWLSATRLSPAAAVGYYGGLNRQVRHGKAPRAGAASLREAGPAYSPRGRRDGADGPSGGGDLLV